MTEFHTNRQENTSHVSDQASSTPPDEERSEQSSPTSPLTVSELPDRNRLSEIVSGTDEASAPANELDPKVEQPRRGIFRRLVDHFREVREQLRGVYEAYKGSREFLERETPKLARSRLYLTIPTALQTVAYPVLLGQFVNSIPAGGSQLMAWGGAMLAFPFIMNSLHTKKNDITTRMTAEINTAEATEFVRQVQDLPFDSIQDTNVLGEIEEVRFNRRLGKFVDNLYHVIDTKVAVAGAVVAMCQINPTIAGVVAAGILPVLVAEWKNAALVNQVERENRDNYIKLWPTSFFATKQDNAIDIKVLGKSEWARDTVREIATDTVKTKQKLFDGLFRAGKIGVAASTATGLVAGGWVLNRAFQGAISAGETIQFLGALAALQMSIGSASKLFGDFVADSIFVKKLFNLSEAQTDESNSVIQTKPQRKFTETEIEDFKQKLAGSDVTIRMKDIEVVVLSQATEDERRESTNTDENFPLVPKTILRVPELCIPAGSMIGIVGKKGAGKSTLMKVLLGLQPVTKGEVTLELSKVGVTSKYVLGQDAPPEAWHRHIGYGPQEGYKAWGLTVKDSIDLGIHEDDRSPLSYERAMKICDVSSFIGEDDIAAVEIGDGQNGNSRKFSDGEVRAIMMTRAVIGNRKVLILDEPTANQDATSEKILVDNLAEFKGDKTQLIVTHSMPATQHADYVISVQKGEVLFGAPEWLLTEAPPNAYRTLYETSLKGHTRHRSETTD